VSPVAAPVPEPQVAHHDVIGRRVVSHRWAGPPDAPEVVAVAGLNLGHRYLVPTAERLARSCEVLAPDLPGFGDSADGGPVLSVAELARHLAGWLDTVELRRPSFVANSFGCQIVAELALTHPERVDRVVLGSPALAPSSRRVPVMLARLVREQASITWALRRIQIGDHRRAGLRRVLATGTHARHDRWEDKLAWITAPTLVVHAGADPHVPRAWSEQIAARLPRGRLVVLPGAPHASCFVDPIPFSRVTERFLTDRPLPPRPGGAP
jgi:2-hydroxy-6-oxonona-2,4-dienedioate hydrolase